MGNLCSKSSNEPDPFSQPGRVLGSAPAAGAKTSASVPSGVSSSQGRTLGSRQEVPSGDDPRSAAAKAAEERANKANKATGKLSGQLAAQKKQTQNQLLQETSDRERGVRVADENEQARNWN